MKASETKKDLVRLQAESDLESFIALVHPKRVLGNVHREIIQWWTRQEALSHQLLLMPRDHQKSALVAYRVAWEITRNPATRILYISSTSNLAVKQLKFIKDILTSDIYRYYWPEMVNKDESAREKWTEREISVDHPKRKSESVRDPTVFTAGLTTGIVGLHCDISVFDDVVVYDNAYNDEGRSKVLDQYSLLASIESADARQWVVGTRYHPKDLYATMMTISLEKYDLDGNLDRSIPLYELFERQVENKGDGSGEFVWPRQMRYDGQWFGFDQEILAKKRAAYQNKQQFRAQYYNDPNAETESAIPRGLFQYYEKALLKRAPEGHWTIKGRKLNVFAAIDFAFSKRKEADFTCIAVVGIDSERNYYVLEISRLKTNSIADYFKEILRLNQNWGFRRLRAEVSVAQGTIVNELKESYIRPYGMALSIEEFRPTRSDGVKEERILAILQPKYENGAIWHYRDGNCQLLEDELVLQNPPHDDIKDAFASAVEFAVAPTGATHKTYSSAFDLSNIVHPRFGGLGAGR